MQVIKPPCTNHIEVLNNITTEKLIKILEPYSNKKLYCEGCPNVYLYLDPCYLIIDNEYMDTAEENPNSRLILLKSSNEFTVGMLIEYAKQAPDKTFSCCGVEKLYIHNHSHYINIDDEE